MEVDSIHEIYQKQPFQDSMNTNIKDLEDITQENELRNNITIEKNNSPNWIVASFNDVFMWIQKHLNRFFKCDQNLSTKQPKNQINDDMKLCLTLTKKELEKKNAVIKEMEIDTKFKENQIKTLRDDQKILENRIDKLVKNEIFNQNYIETLTNTIQENQSSQQKKQLEITKLNDLNNYLKNVLSTNASELDEKESIYQNIIKSLDSKNVKLDEENIKLQLETASKMSEIKLLKDKIHDFQSKEQKLNQQLRDVMNKYKILEQKLSATIDINVKLEEDSRKKKDELISCENKNSVLMKQLKSAEDVLLDQKTQAEKDNQVFKLKVLELQKQLKQCNQKYHKISKDYEILKLSGIQDTDIKLQIQLEKTEKEVFEWQKKYNDSLFENRNIKNKKALQNEVIDFQNYAKFLNNKFSKKEKTMIFCKLNS
ncbi:uncharacterized protein LOC126907776 isoform X2 [Daktulosphaira vitifoliae]|uniref:uncharacterized protein LOC126907776 isoform X2 n=1 Tax=Daktulosphaira vitifoliae TaxID=58002 RepID=UPI0021AAAAF8|nr:uncharacterized protein LOC126907776 isoform X2 [Daktulosphaira vitifoliae]